MWISNGLPLGLQIIGKHFDEARFIAWHMHMNKQLIIINKNLHVRGENNGI